MPQSSRPIIVKALVLLCLAAGGYYSYGRLKGDAAAVVAGPPAMVVPVGTATASRMDVPMVLVGLGNVQPFQQSVLKPQVDGQLVEVGFHEGAQVKAGDVLAKIDPRTYQAAVNQAAAKKAQDEAQLANAKLDAKRYQDLVERNFISRQQLDTTLAQVQQLQAAVLGDVAALDNAKVLLGYTTIRAPYNGRVGIRQVDVGNVVHVSDAGGIVNITQLQPIAVIFSLPEDQVSKVLNAQKSGDLKVQVLSRDSQQVLDEGRLELVDNQIDTTTAMVKLKAISPNQSGLLWPGQFVNAQLVVGTAKDAVTVPVAALQRGQQGSFVWAVSGGNKAEVHPVQVGQISNGVAVIEKGVDAGDVVVTNGHYRLQPGATVAATLAADAAAK